MVLHQSTFEPSTLLGGMYKHVIDKATSKAESMGIPNPMVNSSKSVVDHLKRIKILPKDIDDIFLISFDFSSLYTSISNQSIYQMIIFFSNFIELDVSVTNMMMDLHNFIKQNAYFKVANKHLFLQKDGLAMGSYDSSDGANLVLYKSEINMLQDDRITKHIIAFFRYIDDGCLIMKGKIDDIKQYIKLIVEYYPAELEIEFTINKVQAIFLDLTIYIDNSTYDTGCICHRIYQKPFNTYSYTHFSSNHPNSVFKGIITTECYRYRDRSSNEEEYKHYASLFHFNAS